MLCEESSCSNPVSSLKYKSVSKDMEFYVKASNVSVGDNLSVSVTATNEGYYHMGRLWRPKTGNSQILLGLGYDKEGGSGYIIRKRVNKVNFTVVPVNSSPSFTYNENNFKYSTVLIS